MVAVVDVVARLEGLWHPAIVTAVADTVAAPSVTLDDGSGSGNSSLWTRPHERFQPWPEIGGVEVFLTDGSHRVVMPQDLAFGSNAGWVILFRVSPSGALELGFDRHALDAPSEYGDRDGWNSLPTHSLFGVMTFAPGTWTHVNALSWGV